MVLFTDHSSFSLLILWWITCFSSLYALQPPQPVALLTGATGRTGQIVTNLLLQKGFQVRIFCRDEPQARKTFLRHDHDADADANINIELCEGDMSNKDDIQSAFCDTSKLLTHVVFMAGGEGADYKCVNYRGVAEFARQAADCPTIQNFVVISSAWTTRPYSIASLLFNSLYFDTLPMASHYLGEQALRRASSATDGRLNYVILRAGGLNSDERYAEKYPEAATMGLTYEQGDTFQFLGVAGRPGMSRTQLANAVASAVDIEGRYTVEVTGSGTVGLDDSSVYQGLLQDTGVSVSDEEEEEIMALHTNAVIQLKNTAIGASLGGVALISLYGWFQGLLLVFPMNVMLVLIWSLFFANRQAE